MGLSIDLFVHGVPSGQKVWGSTSEGLDYVKNQYSNEEHAPDFLKVEKVNDAIYYTFFRTQAVRDVNGRPGGYFALTLRINMYYGDVQNLYKVLEAVYRKFCIGRLLKEMPEGMQFLVADFEKEEKLMLQIKDALRDYIQKFSTEGDFDASILPTLPNTKGQMKQINLFEGTSERALSVLKAEGCVSLSPHYSSSAVARVKAEATKAMAEVEQRHKSQTQELAQKYQAEREQMVRQYDTEKNRLTTELKKVKEAYARDNHTQVIAQIREKAAENLKFIDQLGLHKVGKVLMPQDEVNTTSKAEPQSNVKLWAAAAILVILLVVVGYGIFTMFGGSEKADQPQHDVPVESINGTHLTPMSSSIHLVLEQDCKKGDTLSLDIGVSNPSIRALKTNAQPTHSVEPITTAEDDDPNEE